MKPVQTPLRCSKCGVIDVTTDVTQRCNDCCFLKRKDKAGRLLASRCRECCPSGHGIRKAPPEFLIEVEEQMELLDAVKRNLESRLLSVDTPEATLSHAELLERRAEEIFDTAQRIRRALAEDTEHAGELTRRVIAIECEMHLCRCSLQQGVKRVPKGYFEKIVEQHMKKRFGE